MASSYNPFLLPADSSFSLSLNFSPPLSAALCSAPYQTPLNYVGAKIVRPESLLEKEIMRKKNQKKRKANPADSATVNATYVDVAEREKSSRGEEDDVQQHSFPPAAKSAKEAAVTEKIATKEEAKSKAESEKTTFEYYRQLALDRKREILKNEMEQAGISSFDFSGQDRHIGDEWDLSRKCPSAITETVRWHWFDNSEKKQLFEGCVFDKSIASSFAAEITSFLVRVQVERDAEGDRMGMRRLPYLVVPEVWGRMFTDRLDTSSAAPKGSANKDDNNCKDNREDDGNGETLTAASTITVPLRVTSRLDKALKIVTADLISRGMHIGDGSKFGGDYLIYDGDREERHAMGCLRVYRTTSGGRFPNLNPHDVTSFVRTMNTVGKIAIVAIVDLDEETGEGRFGYVDLVLEKVLENRAHKRRGEKEKRKDMTKNLEKI